MEHGNGRVEMPAKTAVHPPVAPPRPLGSVARDSARVARFNGHPEFRHRDRQWPPGVPPPLLVVGPFAVVVVVC